MLKKLIAIMIMACAGSGAQAQTAVLSGTLTVDRNLNADTCYNMQGCFVVPTGKTLTILAGTQVLCDAGSNLVVERGGTILATGTAMAPIVFTSSKSMGSRAPGDWGGIALFGAAPNNESVNATRDVCVARSFGGTTVSDNSGTLQYVRIEYAGSSTNRDEPSGLFLASVGDGTTVDHIQVSESLADGILFYGGTVLASHLLSFNAYQTDFRFGLGNVSKLQFLLGIRKDVNAHVNSSYNANGLYIENDGSGSAATPITLPLISNLTLLGPDYCGTSTSPDFRNGILFNKNGAGYIKNSAVTGWPVSGLHIEDALSIGNTASTPNKLNFSYNAIIPVAGGAIFSNGATWSGTGCNSSMSIWLNGPVTFGCEESNNDFGLTDFGYNSNVCSNYCEVVPDFSYNTTELETTNFSAPFNDAFFTEVDYKGAIQEVDWTLDWTRLCPQQESYCSLALRSSPADISSSIQLTPNPANSQVTATFDATATGKGQLQVLDKITGAVLSNTSISIASEGKQQINFSVQGLKEGVYPVRIMLKGQALYSQIVVK